MGIFQKIKDKIDDNRVERLRRYLLMIQKQDFEYNPFKLGMPKKLIDTTNANFELIENFVWGSGDGAAIREFYRKNQSQFLETFDPRTNYFANTCPDKFRYTHSGLPNLISDTMAQVIFGNGYKIEGVVYKTDSLEVDEEASKQVTDIIQYLMGKININEKLIKSAVMESVGGDVAWKLSYDFSLSPYPILEVEDRRYYTVNCSRGIEQDFDFKTYIDKVDNQERKQYIFVESYTQDNGTFAIINRLYQNDNGKFKSINLSYLEETRELEPIIKTTYDGKLAFHKKNKEYTGIISNFPYGASDYTSAKDSFDAVDEACSAIISEIRDNKTIREWDESMLTVDANTGNFKAINKYITNYVAKPRSNDQNVKGVNVTQFEDKTEQHIAKLNAAISLACAACKISPITLGLKGDTAVDSDDATLKERTEITRETATKKKQAWTDYLNKVIPEIIKFAKWLTLQDKYPFNTETVNFKKMMAVIDINNINVAVEIVPFDVKSVEDQLTTWGTAKSAGITSIENVVEQLYGTKWTQDEKQAEVNRIKIEQNITLDNPELLQFEDNE